MAHQPPPDVNLPTATGTTVLHLAVSKNHYDLVDFLIGKYGAKARVADKRRQTPLHRAAAIGSQPAIRRLVEARANVNAQDSDGWTPLHHALAEGHGDAALLLVSLGADASVESSAGETAAAVASEPVRRYFEARASST